MNNDMKIAQKIFKAIGDKNRLRIIKLLQNKEGVCVCEICDILGVSQSTTSQHLRVLEEADLIYSSRDGKWINYHLNHQSHNAKVEETLSLLAGWLEEDTQVQSDRDKLLSTDRNVLCRQ